MTLQEKYGDTEILVLPSQYSIASANDIFEMDESEADNILRLCEWKLRYEAETDMNFRQVIPYLIIQCGDRYLMTTRLDGDSRLVGKMSIGVGGHIEKKDGECSTYDAFQTGLLRELYEELKINTRIYGTQLVAGISCSDTEVDRVHLGLVYVLRVDSEDVSIKETDTLKGEWTDADLLLANYKACPFETWSKLCIKYLIGGERINWET